MYLKIRSLAARSLWERNHHDPNNSNTDSRNGHDGPHAIVLMKTDCGREVNWRLALPARPRVQQLHFNSPHVGCISRHQRQIVNDGR